MIFIDTGAFLARRKALMITNKSHGPAIVAATDVSKGDSSAIRHDVRLRPWIGDILTALVIAHFFHFYGWIAGTISLLIGIGLRRKRIVGIARKVHPVAWLCLASFIVTLAALVTVQEYRTYQARAMVRAVDEAGGQTLNDGSIQFAGPEITDANLNAIKHLIDTDSLSLHETSITDGGLVAIAGWKLKMLFIQSNLLTDQSLLHIRNLDQLERLELTSTQVTDAGLSQLKGFKKLQILDLSCCTNVTEAGVQSLESALPKCEIRWSPDACVPFAPHPEE